MRVCLFILFLALPIFSFSQDSSVKKPIIGIYGSYEEYLSGTPSKTVPFKMRQVAKNLDDGSREVWFTFDVKDNSPRPKDIFCIYDGEAFYLQNSDSNFTRFEFVGRYPYRVEKVLVMIKGDGPKDPAKFGGIQETLYYVGRKGKEYLATAQSVGFLLLQDKELLKKFEKEKKYNYAILQQYLEELNERYPL